MGLLNELIMNMGLVTVFAEGEQAAETADAAAATPVSSGVINIVFIIFLIALMYFMLIRPQKKREKEAKAMLDALKVGDKVVTIGGICGKIAKIKDDFVIIETGNIGTQDEKSYLKMERDAVKSVETKQSN